MERIPAIVTLKYLVDNSGLVLPGNRTAQKLEEDIRKHPLVLEAKDYYINKSFWDAFLWNPSPLLGWDYDPNASPKPTWQDLLDAHYAIELERFGELESWDQGAQFGLADGFKWRKRTRDFLADDEISHNNKDVHVGEGLTHMTGLAHLVESSNIAGRILPPVNMRDNKGEMRMFYTQSDLRDIMEILAERENIIHSAHNTIVVTYEKLREKSNDKSLTSKERFQAHEEARKLINTGSIGPNFPKGADNTYYHALLEEIKKYDPNALPDDLLSLRIVYSERLEATATKKMKDIQNAITQHGIDLPPSCLDQQNAMTKVSEKKQKGQIELIIMEKETGRSVSYRKKKLGEIYELWKTRIEEVRALNVPIYTINGQAVTGNKVTITHPDDVTIIAKQPISGIPGSVVIEDFSATGNHINTRFEIPKQVGNIAQHQVSVSLKDDNFSGTITMNLKARNLCGPCDLTIEWTRVKTPVGS